MKTSLNSHIYDDVSHFTLAELEELRHSLLASSRAIPSSAIDARIAELSRTDHSKHNSEHGFNHWSTLSEESQKSGKELFRNLFLMDYYLDAVSARDARNVKLFNLRFETDRQLNAIAWVGDRRERWTGIEATTVGSTKTREEWDISARDARKDVRALFKAGLINRDDAKEFNAAAREISVSARRNDREGFVRAQEKLERIAEDSPALQDIACKRLAICEFDNDSQADLTRPINLSSKPQGGQQVRQSTTRRDEDGIASQVSLSASFRQSHLPLAPLAVASRRDRDEAPSPMIQLQRMASFISSAFSEYSPRMA
jgi:hypothetical protein